MPLDKRKILDGIKEAKEKSQKRKFLQSVDLIITLQDVDPKKPESRIQEFIELPFAAQKGSRICVIASGEMALKAKKAGADLVLEQSDVQALAGNKKQQKELAKTSDFFIAEAPLMPLVGKMLGATLGPKGKMPTPVSPTANIAEQINRHRRMVLVRLRGQPVLQCRVGNENMANEEIAENVQTIVRKIEGTLKRGLRNIKSIHIKTSMSAPVKIAM